MKNIFCLWITGISGAGKTTLANKTKEHLTAQGHNVILLDGDDVRASINDDLNFTMESRDENIRRIAQLAKLLSKQNIVTIVSVISPMEIQRNLAHEIYGDSFHLIYLKASLKRCENNDVKGLYKKAEQKKIENFTGMSSPYEEPRHPHLMIDTDVNNEISTANLLEQYINKIIN